MTVHGRILDPLCHDRTRELLEAHREPKDEVRTLSQQQYLAQELEDGPIRERISAPRGLERSAYVRFVVGLAGPVGAHVGPVDREGEERLFDRVKERR